MPVQGQLIPSSAIDSKNNQLVRLKEKSLALWIKWPYNIQSFASSSRSSPPMSPTGLDRYPLQYCSFYNYTLFLNGGNRGNCLLPEWKGGVPFGTSLHQM